MCSLHRKSQKQVPEGTPGVFMMSPAGQGTQRMDTHLGNWGQVMGQHAALMAQGRGGQTPVTSCVDSCRLSPWQCPSPHPTSPPGINSTRAGLFSSASP